MFQSFDIKFPFIQQHQQTYNQLMNSQTHNVLKADKIDDFLLFIKHSKFIDCFLNWHEVSWKHFESNVMSRTIYLHQYANFNIITCIKEFLKKFGKFVIIVKSTSRFFTNRH